MGHVLRLVGFFRKLWICFLLSLLGILFLQGCSSTTKTTTTDTRVVMNAERSDAADSSSPVTTTETKTTTQEQKEDSGSLVGAIFRFAGEVISFPFRLVGGMLDAIF